jgi:hypothetical protein
MTVELDIVEVGEDRWHVIDGRGRYVAGFPDEPTAHAFVVGYRTGREDAREIVTGALDGLGPRVGSVRRAS